MKYSVALAVRWLLYAILLSLIPLALALVGPLPAPRPFWVEFGVGLGFVGMGLMIVQFLTSGRFRWVAPVFGADVVLQFHRQAGIAAVLMVLAHPVVLILADPVFLAYFDPRENFLRALSLSFVVVALVAILVTSLWREPVGLNYEWWRLLHGGLALAIVFIGMVHGIQVGHYLESLWRQGIWVGVLAGTLYLVIHTRVVRPLRAKRKPYQIVDVKDERGNGISLWIEPDGHEGMGYAAGQYCWITVGDPPYKLQQHPFSFSAAEDPARIRLTAAEFGDFTARWKDFTPGMRVYLEGPFGAFTLEPDAQGIVLIMGGIGVTPALSILHTMRARGDARPVYFFYGNPTWEDITFRAEIEELEKALNLKVIHVLEDPPDDWQGEEGFITQEILDRYLPDTRHEYGYYICGPKPLLDSNEQALRDLGISWRRIYTERFEIV